MRWRRKYWFRPQGVPAGSATCRRRTRYARQNENLDQDGLEALLQPNRRELGFVGLLPHYRVFNTNDPENDEALLLVYGKHLVYVERRVDRNFNLSQVDKDIRQLKYLKLSRLTLLLLLASIGPAIAGSLHPGSLRLAYLIFLACNAGVCSAIIIYAVMRAYK